MRLIVIAVGRVKQGPERELAERYRERFDDIGRKLGFRGLEIYEIPESRSATPRRASRRRQPHIRVFPEKIRADCAGRTRRASIAPRFAQHLGRFRDAATDVIFVIGGRTDFRPNLRGKAKPAVAFGQATSCRTRWSA